MKVRNINGTTDNSCKCRSWLEHWEKFGGKQLPEKCPAEGCNNKPTLGAHVQKENKNDNNWYIIPLCKACNNKKDEFLTVSDYIELVPANKSETCGKK